MMNASIKFCADRFQLLFDLNMAVKPFAAMIFAVRPFQNRDYPMLTEFRATSARLFRRPFLASNCECLADFRQVQSRKRKRHVRVSAETLEFTRTSYSRS